MKRRTYTARPDSERCKADRLPLPDGSEARCMRPRKRGSEYCAQHDRIIYGWRPSEAALASLNTDKHCPHGHTPRSCSDCSY